MLPETRRSPKHKSARQSGAVVAGLGDQDWETNLMTDTTDQLPDDDPDTGNDAPTRIIGLSDSDDNDNATRILPMTPSGGGERASDRGQGAVIGRSGNRPAQNKPETAVPENQDADDRTVLIPSGARPSSDAPATTVPASMPGTTQSETSHPQQASGAFDPAVAWLVIVEGPGRGQHLNVYYGQNTIGRAADQRIRLNFGDNRIAREAHAFVVYDDVDRKYYLRDNGKSNLVRLNGKPVMTPMEIVDRDQISIGETVMVFVAFCDKAFDWLAQDDGADTASPSS